MTVGYHHRRRRRGPRAIAAWEQAIQDRLGRRVTSCPAAAIDPAISQLLLDAVTPVALEVALSVQSELEARVDEADALRASHVERARHRAELARRRYLAVDPDNRLVADSLEADWNDTLRQLRASAKTTTERASERQPNDCAQRRTQGRACRALATDFPRLWSDPATPVRERKRIARLLIEDVTVVKAEQDPPARPLPGLEQPRASRLPLPLERAGKPARPTPTPLGRSRSPSRRPTRTPRLPRLLNRDGHRSGTGKPFTVPDRAATYAAATTCLATSERLQGQRSAHACPKLLNASV